MSTKKMKLEHYGYCSNTGRCLNPFGARPLWVIAKAAKIRQEILLASVEDALF